MVPSAAQPDQKPSRTIATVERIHVDGQGRRTVTVVCPHCGATHQHGWPLGSTRTRSAHCASGVHLAYDLDVRDDHPSSHVTAMRTEARALRGQPERAELAGRLRAAADYIESGYARG